MNLRPHELHAQRLVLRERVARQRAELARQCAPLNHLAEAAGGGMALGRRLLAQLKQHPLPVLALAGALLLAKPRLTWRWARRGLLLWRGWQLLRQRVPGGLDGLKGLWARLKRAGQARG